MPGYWLAKSEPDVYSIDDLARDKTAEWEGVRNYQARNFLREMKKGDHLLFYHSNAKPPGVAGVAKVEKVAYPDPTQFDSKSKYFDPKATKDDPRWFCPDVKFVEKFDEIVSLHELKQHDKLKEMKLLQRGSRLSVMPITKREFEFVVKLGR